MIDSAPRQVRVHAVGRLGRITLNRPAKINALTVDMIGDVRAALARFDGDGDVDAVVIDGAGERGLCAGGDIVAVYRAIRGAHGDPGGRGAPSPEEFWGDEYRMNLEISRYRKPLIAVMDGIVMGGGVGIAGHASVRIVTETSQVAMPETAIGLSPDVGGLYLLARAPGEIGTHAALTGARLGAADAIAARLADHFVPRANLPLLADRLAAALGSAAGDGRAGGGRPAGMVATTVADTVAGLSSSPPPGRWVADRPWIDACYRGDDAREILRRLRHRPEPAATRAAEALAAMSPTAVAVALRAIRNAASLPLAQVLEQDLMLCTRFLAHPDFAEGIRARVIDKDRSPRWRPAALGEVTAAVVDAFFAAPPPATGRADPLTP